MEFAGSLKALKWLLSSGGGAEIVHMIFVIFMGPMFNEGELENFKRRGKDIKELKAEKLNKPVNSMV